MRIIYFFLLLLLSFTGTAQVLKGVVVDGESKSPVPGASVFLTNTSVGTTANAKGEFEISIPQGRYDLIVSSIGFETYSQTIASGALPAFLTITLQPKAKELATVVVEPFVKDGWAQWGKFFLNNFIGTTPFAPNCKIKNTHVIKFRNSKQTGELTAIALEPLIIENKDLGYTIRYQLENFSYNFKTRYLLYQGYPLFEPMMGGNSKQKRWETNRQKAYEGSMMHFMRSLYVNKFMEEGFEVRRIKKVVNEEKLRVKALQQRLATNAGNTVQVLKSTINTALPSDSTDYYQKILRQPDGFDIMGATPLPGDSIAFAVNSVTAGLEFEDYLMVMYKKKMAPPEYTRAFPDNGTGMNSQITLLNDQHIEIEYNGNYYQPSNLLSLGYWGWSEKIANLLPFDYKPKSSK